MFMKTLLRNVHRTEKNKNNNIMKKATITLESIKCTDGWFELGIDLGFSHDKINKIFEYGEYGNIEIEVDEKLNIIGGKIIPCGK